MIKLFSPNIKYRNSVPASLQQATPLDKPYFPISMRLLRVVSILIQKYHSLLVNISDFTIDLIDMEYKQIASLLRSIKSPEVRFAYA